MSVKMDIFLFVCYNRQKGGGGMYIALIADVIDSKLFTKEIGRSSLSYE